MPRVRAAVRPPGGPAPAAPDPAGTSSMSVKKPPLRRAASAVPALPPTPPRTTHKRKRRSRSRVTDSSSEEEDVHDVPEPESDREDDHGDPDHRHKKRKLLTLDTIAEELSAARAEEEFWLGNEGASSSTAVASSNEPPKRKVVKNRAPSRARSRTRSPSASPAPHLLRRGHTGLFSPPPSRRAPTFAPRPATPPPTVHKQKAKAKEFPKRDSPNNPFLVDTSPGSVPDSDDLSSPEPRTPQRHAEKPTIAVVFRGHKAIMHNPHYVPEDVAALREARARLPTSHPDFEASDACAPTLLFPEVRKRDHAARRRVHPSVPVPTSPTPTTSKRSRAGSASSEEGRGAAGKRAAHEAPGPSIIAEEEDIQAMSAAMANNIARRMRKGVLADGDAPRTRPSSRSGDPPQPPEKDRSDPIKRALGPLRRG